MHFILTTSYHGWRSRFVDLTGGHELTISNLSSGSVCTVDGANNEYGIARQSPVKRKHADRSVTKNAMLQMKKAPRKKPVA